MWSLPRKKLTDGPAGEFNFHRFSADDCTPQALADAIDAMPMMAERTLVRVDDVDLFKQPEGAREQYAAILSDIPDYCCVLFVYDTVEFKINSTMKKAGGRRQGARADRFVRQAVRAQFVRVDHAPLPRARQERHGRAVSVSDLPHRRADDHARRGRSTRSPPIRRARPSRAGPLTRWSFRRSARRPLTSATRS